MILIQRANKQLRIPDDKLNYYIKQGYHEVKKTESNAKKKPAPKKTE